MSNPTLEPTIKELMELRRMKEEIDAEIIQLEDQIKQAIVNTDVVLNLFSQPQHIFLVLPLIHFKKRHISIKVFVKPQITLTVMPDRILSEIALPTVLKIEITPLLKSYGFICFHRDFQHQKHLISA